MSDHPTSPTAFSALFKKPWVGLTDEEVDSLLDEMSVGCASVDVRIVEAKIKEKNK